MGLSRKRKKTGHRRHVRYKDMDCSDVKIFYYILNSKKIFFNALIVNESYSGFACVFAGKQPFKKGQEIFWRETENLITTCRVTRCKKIEEGVYLLGLGVET